MEVTSGISTGRVAEGVSVGVSEGVGVAVKVEEGVAEGVPVKVAVKVGSGVKVEVRVASGIGVRVAVSEGSGVGVKKVSGVEVGVSVGARVGVWVDVAVVVSSVVRVSVAVKIDGWVDDDSSRDIEATTGVGAIRGKPGHAGVSPGLRRNPSGMNWFISFSVKFRPAIRQARAFQELKLTSHKMIVGSLLPEASTWPFGLKAIAATQLPR